MKGLLVALYPARWRERYGDEFRTLLDERPMGPLDVVDIAVAAFQARLQGGQPGSADALPVLPRSLRIGGWAAILGGLFWIGAMLGLSNHDESNPLPRIAFALAEITLLLALVGLSAFQARRDPELAWLAFLVPAAGIVVSLTGLAAMSLTGDGVIVGDLSGWSLWIIGIIAFALGSVAFAASCGHEGTFRTARSLGILTAVFLVAATLTMSGIFGEVSTLVLAVAWVAHGACWVRLGAEAVRLDGRLPASPAG